MFEIPTIVLVVIGFTALIVGIAALAGDPYDSFAGMFSTSIELGRARGVQETDLPRFVFRDAAPAAAG